MQVERLNRRILYSIGEADRVLLLLLLRGCRCGGFDCGYIWLWSFWEEGRVIFFFYGGIRLVEWVVVL